MIDEWRKCRWGDLISLEYGKGIRGYENGDGPYLVYGTNGPIGKHSVPLCNHPSVIIGRKGAYRGVHYSSKPFYVIDTAFYLEPKEDIDLKWAYYELLTHDINSMDSGSAIPSTSRDAFYSLPVNVPPLPEQHIIAHILGTLDEKIELNRQMNYTLEAMARAIFKSWFVDFDPMRAKMEGREPNGMDTEMAALFPDSFEDSLLEEIPKGWDIQPLDQIADFLNGLALQKFPHEGTEYLPVIKIAELKRGVNESSGKASPNLDKKYIIEDGDVIFSWSGSLEVVIWCGGKGALNQHLFKVTSLKYPKWFYYQWIKYHLSEFQAIAAGKATTMGHIQRYHLSAAYTIVPPQNTLNRMDQIMAPIFDLFINNEKESQTLANIRDTLLPKLLTGEIRVKDAEKYTEAHL